MEAGGYKLPARLHPYESKIEGAPGWGNDILP